MLPRRDPPQAGFRGRPCQLRGGPGGTRRAGRLAGVAPRGGPPRPPLCRRVGPAGDAAPGQARRVRPTGDRGPARRLPARFPTIAGRSCSDWHTRWTHGANSTGPPDSSPRPMPCNRPTSRPGPGLSARGASVVRRSADRCIHPRVLRSRARSRAGYGTAGLRRGHAAVGHVAGRAGPGESPRVFGAGELRLVRGSFHALPARPAIPPRRRLDCLEHLGRECLPRPRRIGTSMHSMP